MTATKNKYLVPFIIVTSLFFTWGFITVLVDALIPRLRDVFTLTYFQAGLVQVAFLWCLLPGLVAGRSHRIEDRLQAGDYTRA
jgi:fucose permease